MTGMLSAVREARRESFVAGYLSAVEDELGEIRPPNGEIWREAALARWERLEKEAEARERE